MLKKVSKHDGDSLLYGYVTVLVQRFLVEGDLSGDLWGDQWFSGSVVQALDY